MSSPADAAWLHAILLGLQGLPIPTAVREDDRLFPWVECFHVLALTLVLGSIAMVDLRLIGLTSRQRPFAETSTLVLPLTWSAFAVALLTGGLLFASNAITYAGNVWFQAKMLLILLAGLNMAVFQLLLGRSARNWTTSAATPWPGRCAGAISLMLWIAIVACGRWIGFTLNAVN
jgi:uncharacterized membrane protein